MITDGAASDERWLAFRSRSFLLYWIAQLLAGFAVQIQTVAVAWQVYDITRDPLYLGLVGLSQFLPSLFLVLVTGSIADRFSRKWIIIFCLAAEAGVAGGLLYFTLSGSENVLWVFALLAVLGTARAFYNPARQAIVPNLVPRPHVANAITLTTTAGQIATIAGPVLGGLLYGVTAPLAYSTSLMLLLIGIVFVTRMERPAQDVVTGRTTWETVSAGFRYIWREKIILGAISLDLFAVLLGGAMALLPVYARDILEIGPFGLGILKAAPAAGAILVGVYLMTRPIQKNAGVIMLAAVFMFGVFTLIFAISTVAWISILALFMLGGCDMVSVFVRNTLIQLWTPDSLRGRVTAVSQLFVGASNEVGAFRAGTTAALIGTVPAVLVGGVGTVAIAAIWYRVFPDLRRVQHLNR
jgi:MFS family permease